MTATMITVSVPAMHKQVHERAGRKEQPRQPRQHVGLMFGNKEETSDQREPDQDKLEP